MELRYRLIFEKLAEATEGERVGSDLPNVQITYLELDEIRELCRLSTLVSEPEPSSYTTT